MALPSGSARARGNAERQLLPPKLQQAPTDPQGCATSGADPLAPIEAWFERKGWTPMPFQRRCWQAFLEGRSGLVQVPTGSGKTVVIGATNLPPTCFQNLFEGCGREMIKVVWKMQSVARGTEERKIWGPRIWNREHNHASRSRPLREQTQRLNRLMQVLQHHPSDDKVEATPIVRKIFNCTAMYLVTGASRGICRGG